uniref:Uncharacterized protein n=1 Tax=Setaria viridis TaxID=4556 RepID=A0A4U6UBL1_SETVI|nr:hypothetical protein SEVIR_6G230632v2 [Setaria viridis]
MAFSGTKAVEQECNLSCFFVFGYLQLPVLIWLICESFVNKMCSSRCCNMIFHIQQQCLGSKTRGIGSTSLRHVSTLKSQVRNRNSSLLEQSAYMVASVS